MAYTACVQRITGNDDLDTAIAWFAADHPDCNKVGACDEVSRAFTEMLRDYAIEACGSAERHPLNPFLSPNSGKWPHHLGYGEAEGLYDTHYVTIARAGGEFYSIDFTAGQFGRSEWPLVQRMIAKPYYENYVNEWGNEDVRTVPAKWELIEHDLRVDPSLRSDAPKLPDLGKPREVQPWTGDAGRISAPPR